MPRELSAEVRKASVRVQPGEVRLAREAMERENGLSEDHAIQIGNTAQWFAGLGAVRRPDRDVGDGCRTRAHPMFTCPLPRAISPQVIKRTEIWGLLIIGAKDS